jgi:DNA-binding transcriptional regulator YiaG
MNLAICPSCGKPTAAVSALETYRYKESGIPNLWLRGGVTETVCASCKKKHIKIEKESQLLQVIALKFLMDARPLSGYEMRFLRGACGLSQARLAELLRHRRETISERETKKNPGIDFAEEVFFRLVMLRYFTEQLNTEGNNFLPDSQRKLLDDFTRVFCDFSEKFTRKMLRRSAKLVAALDDQGELWSLDEAA